MPLDPVEFEFEIKIAEGLEWDENSLLAAYVHLYMDYKSYTANKINWLQVRESLKRAEAFMSEQGVIVEITNDNIG